MVIMSKIQQHLLLFDLDGVLYDSQDMHYHALNDALKFWGIKPIDYDDHLRNYNGLPTWKKLEILNVNFPYREKVEIKKQEITYEEISKFGKDKELREILSALREKYLLAVASNSKRRTVYTALDRLGIIDLFTVQYSAEDVSRPKPYPEIYWKCMSKVGCTVLNTIAIEDSPIGIEGILASGIRRYIKVDGRDDLNDITPDYLSQLMRNEWKTLTS